MALAIPGAQGVDAPWVLRDVGAVRASGKLAYWVGGRRPRRQRKRKVVLYPLERVSATGVTCLVNRRPAVQWVRWAQQVSGSGESAQDMPVAAPAREHIWGADDREAA